jgi:hypothetical protein
VGRTLTVIVPSALVGSFSTREAGAEATPLEFPPPDAPASAPATASPTAPTKQDAVYLCVNRLTVPITR